MNNFLHINLCLSILFFLTNALSAQSTVDTDIAAIENGLVPAIVVKGEPIPKASIEDRMKHFNVPGLSIAVVKDGKLHWAKSYGMAQEGKAVANNTLFQAGSISKPLAALAALKLYEEGKVDLDTDVNQYLKDWQIPESDFTKDKKVTLRLLLTHSAGTTVHGFPGYTQEDEFPSIISVLNGAGNTPKIASYAEPGSNWKYSGGGYTIMEKVVEDVSGMPLEDYMAKHIFPKIGMEHSTYAQPLPEEFHAQASAAYKGDGSVYKGLWHNYPEQAAAGLWTTPTDLAKYVGEVIAIYKGKETGVLSQKTIKEMLTPHMNGWGLGPGTQGEGEKMAFGHGGKNAGFTNDMRAMLHPGNGIIVMTSADRGGEVISEISRSISDHYGWGMARPAREIEIKEISKKELKQLAGKYRYNEQVPGIGDYFVHVSVKNGKLQVDDPNDGVNYTLDYLGDMKFLDIKENEQIGFEKDDKGAYSAFKLNGQVHFDKVEE